jgi:hypothetical protein
VDGILVRNVDAGLEVGRTDKSVGEFDGVKGEGGVVVG